MSSLENALLWRCNSCQVYNMICYGDITRVKFIICFVKELQLLSSLEASDYRTNYCSTRPVVAR